LFLLFLEKLGIPQNADPSTTISSRFEVLYSLLKIRGLLSFAPFEISNDLLAQLDIKKEQINATSKTELFVFLIIFLFLFFEF
jgi:hypothetical protein